MADTEDKEKAEKVAAARKRVEQLKKQRAKKADKDRKEKEGDSTANAPAESTNIDSNANGGEIKTIAGAVSERSLDPEDDSPSQSTYATNSDETPKHERPPSLSLQSRMRSESFRRAVPEQPLTSPPLKSPALIGEGDSVQDIYKKQAARIEQLETDNKQLEKELEDTLKALQNSEAEIENLEEAQDEVADLKMKAAKADETTTEVEKLKSEVASLQRQNSHLQSSAANQKRRPSSTASPLPTEDVLSQLLAKTSNIETLELETSNLRHSLSKSESTTLELQALISTLEARVQKAEATAETAKTDLATLKASVSIPSSVNDFGKPAVEANRTRLLQSDLLSAQTAADAAISRATSLEKKMDALTTLHREAESRNQSQSTARLREVEKLKQEVAETRRKIGSMSNENARLRESTARERKAGTEGDGGGVEDMEEEERDRLLARIRELEGETFDLKRGVWMERRQELQPQVGEDGEVVGNGRGGFDDVDLSAASPLGSMADRMGMSSGLGAFTNVLNVFTGGGGGAANSKPGGGARRQTGQHQQRQNSHGKGQGGGFLDDDDDLGFDEDAFRAAQEEQAKARLERVREVKRGLSAWKGWRVDLVDVRGGVMAGVFDV